MNLALSDEQVFLREAARGALSRFKTLEAARDALDTQGGTPHGEGQADGKGELPDLWPIACEAGWPGLLIDDAHGGADLDAFDAMLVLGECGRVLAGVALLGHLPATAILSESAAPAAAALLPALASGEQRAAYLPACPPNDVLTPGASIRCMAPSVLHRRSLALLVTVMSLSVGPMRSCPTRLAPTCSWAWRCSPASPLA